MRTSCVCVLLGAAAIAILSAAIVPAQAADLGYSVKDIPPPPPSGRAWYLKGTIGMKNAEPGGIDIDEPGYDDSFTTHHKDIKSTALYGFGMVMAGSFAPMTYMNDEAKAEAATKEWDAVLAKHKIDMKPDDAPPSQNPNEIKMRARALFKNTDLKAFVTDAAAFVKKHSGKQDKGEATPDLTGALTDVKVDGDNATAKIDGKEQKFSKVDGRWYIRLEM